MTDISITAETARESSRHADGTFGAQERSPAEVSLGPRESLHPDVVFRQLDEKKARHERLKAEGAFATSYDNVFIDDFEMLHPDATPADATDALFDLPGEYNAYTEQDDYFEGDERMAAAAELSRRAAAGREGTLREAAYLRRGDRIDIGHLEQFSDLDETVAASEIVEVDGFDGATGDGDWWVRLRVDEGSPKRYLTVPIGSWVPVVEEARR